MELRDVLTFIAQADDLEINEIIDALTARYKAVYPDWEVAFLSMPLNDPERRRAIWEHATKYI